jgi:hypothetical protein
MWKRQNVERQVAKATFCRTCKLPKWHMYCRCYKMSKRQISKQNVVSTFYHSTLCCVDILSFDIMSCWQFIIRHYVVWTFCHSTLCRSTILFSAIRNSTSKRGTAVDVRGIVEQNIFLIISRIMKSDRKTIQNQHQIVDVRWRGQKQGEQFGRIFAYVLGDCLLWAVYFEKIQKKPNFRVCLHRKKNLCINFDKKWVRLHYRQFFSKSHLVTLDTKWRRHGPAFDALRQKAIWVLWLLWAFERPECSLHGRM